MGGTAMIGLGLALARPDRRVAVITGDGDMLMGLGSLATIGVKRPSNLSIVVLNNAHYGETGMHPSHTLSGVDLTAVALACRFKHAHVISRLDEAAGVRALLRAGEGPLLFDARIKAEEVPRVLPLRDGHVIKERFVAALNST
jgi:thiamine pyrophosphate-dependent acetolactate synthase large subunit-like protein